MGVLVIFLAVQIHQSSGLSWWGNDLNGKSACTRDLSQSAPSLIERAFLLPSPILLVLFFFVLGGGSERRAEPFFFSTAIDGATSPTPLLTPPITGFAPPPAQLQLS